MAKTEFLQIRLSPEDLARIRRVAEAGGWSSLEALKLAYQQPDDETMLQVVDHDAELRRVG